MPQKTRIPALPTDLLQRSPLVVSLAGRQPAAVALPLRSLLDQGLRPAGLILLCTPDKAIQQAAEHLLTWARQQGIPNPEIRILEDGKAAAPHLEASAQELGELNAPLVFLSQAGLAEYVTRLAMALPRERTWFASVDYDQLQLRPAAAWEQVLRLPAGNLGLESLLALVGLQASWSARLPSRLPGPVRGLLDQSVLKDFPHLVYDFDLPDQKLPERVFAAFEAYGRLHLLFDFEPAQDRKKTLNNIRRICGMRLNGLSLQLAALAGAEIDQRQFRANQVPCFGLSESPAERKPKDGHRGPVRTRNRLQHWLQAQTPPNNQPSEAGINRKAPQGSFSQPATGGHLCEKLVVCLGADASATLSSLASHRPRQAWVIYDQHTARVCDHARSLLQQQALLGIETLHLVPDDLHGSGLGLWARQQARQLQDARVDIQPGSKEQSLALALAFAPHQLWKLDTFLGQATPLVPAAGTPLPLQTHLEALARINGAVSMSQPLSQLPSAWQALTNVPKLTAVAQVRDQSGLVESIRFETSTGKPIVCAIRPATRQSNDFEQLVAALLSHLQPDELHGNLIWPLPSRSPRQRVSREHLMQLDLALRLGNWILAVECKFGHPAFLAQQCKAHVTRTRNAFGRLNALPVMIVPERRTAQPELEGCLFWDLTDLLDAQRLRSWIDQACTRRASLR